MLSLCMKWMNGSHSQYEDLKGDTREKEKDELTQTYSTDGQTERFALPEYRLGNKDSQETYTVEEAIDKIGFGKFQIKLSILTGLAWMADAMEMMILSILSSSVHCIWQLTSVEEAAITTVVFCGMFSSSGLWGGICDNYGRRTELILCSLVTCYFGVLSAFSPGLIWLLILRGLVGCGIGGAPQAVTLYAEFLPSHTRAVSVTLVEVFWAAGACFEVFLAVLVMPQLGWRWLLGLSSMPLLLFALTCVWLPESAHFDLNKGRYDKAVKTLERIAQENGQPMPSGRLVCPHVATLKAGYWEDLLKPPLRTTTLLLWVIWFVSAFCYYGCVLVTTSLFEHPDGCHGTDSVFQRAPECNLECRSLTREDLEDIIWTTVAEFPGLFLTAFLLEAIGRKLSMALLFGGFVVFIMLVNFCSNRALLTLFLFVARAFISGAFQGVYVYTPEYYPTSLRALGLGVCSALARAGAIVTPFIAQVLLRTSVYLAICVYGTTCLVAVICALSLPFETKGQEMK